MIYTKHPRLSIQRLCSRPQAGSAAHGQDGLGGDLPGAAYDDTASGAQDFTSICLDVALGIKQGRFDEPLDEFVIDAHLAILRTGVSARLAGAGPDVSARAAEYQLRILGMSVAEAREVRLTNELKGAEPSTTVAHPSDI